MPFRRAKKSSSIEKEIEIEIEAHLRHRIPGITGVRASTRSR